MSGNEDEEEVDEEGVAEELRNNYSCLVMKLRKGEKPYLLSPEVGLARAALYSTFAEMVVELINNIDTLPSAYEKPPMITGLTSDEAYIVETLRESIVKARGLEAKAAVTRTGSDNPDDIPF